MARKRELRVEISGDSSGAQKALGDVDAKATTSQGRLGQLGSKISGFFDNVGLGGSKASGALGGVSEALGGAVNPATLAAGAVAGLTAVVGKGIGDFTKLAGEVRTFKQLSGATAEDSSRFVAVLDDFGISADTGANAIFKLGRGAETNKEKLADLGVELVKNADGSLNLTETTLNVADAYARTTDPAKRAELATVAFGKGGKDLIPVLEQGRKGLDEFFKGADNNFQLLSDEDLAKARDYELAIDALGDATSGLSREIGSAAAPAVADFANALAGLITTVDNLAKPIGGAGGLFSEFGRVLQGPVLGPINDVRDAFDKFRGVTDDVVDAEVAAEAQSEALAEATDELADSQKEAAEAARKQEKAINDLFSAQEGVIDSDIRLENATRKVRDATVEQSAAFEAAHAAKGKDTEANKKNEEATQALKQALVDQAKATRDKSVDELAAQGVTATAEEKTRLYKDELQRLAGTLAPGNPLRAELEGYAGQLQDIPAAKETLITAKADGIAQVEADFRALERLEIRIPVILDPNLGKLANAAEVAGDKELVNRLRAGARAGIR